MLSLAVFIVKPDGWKKVYAGDVKDYHYNQLGLTETAI